MPKTSPTLSMRLWEGRDPLRYALFTLLLLNVSRINSHFSAVNVLRPQLMLAVMVAAYAILNPRAVVQARLLSSPQAKMMLALGVMACVGVPFGYSVGGSGLFIITEYSKVLLTAFLIIAAIRHSGDLHFFVWSYVISSGILVWMAWFVFGLSSERSQVARLANMYTYDANDLGLVLLVGLVLSFLTFQSSKGIGKIVSLIVILSIGATIARTGSRGAFVGLIVVGASLLVMMKSVPIQKRLITVAAVGVALTLAAGPGYWDQMRTMLSPKDDYNWSSADGRKEGFKRGMGYMLANPLTGLGIGNYGMAECTISDKAVNAMPGRGVKCNAAHNTWAQVGAELGIPGLILWIAFVFGCVTSTNRLRRKIPKTWRRGDREGRFLYNASLYFPVAIIGFMASSTFLSFAWVDIVYILAGFTAGLQQAVRVKLQQDLPGPPRRGTAPLLQPKLQEFRAPRHVLTP